jgi:hypothetical protein
MKKLNVKKILLILLALLVIIQVFSIDKTRPEIVASEDLLQSDAVPEDVKTLLRNACADCHSFETKYPWYTNIEPLSWWIKGHIKGGRQKLNFSIWNSYPDKRKAHKIDECIEVLEQKRMPMKSYTWIHSEAKLSDENNKRLMAYFESLR